jgi:hypothetical protein
VTAAETRSHEVGTILPLSDVVQYLTLIVADVLILAFWWFVMSRLGDR